MPSLYIHIPFCTSKCLFCSFVIAVGQAHRVDEYLSALKQEAQKYRGTKISTVYVGGGTPSFLTTDQIRKLEEIIKGCFDFQEGEFSFEANPESVDCEKLKVLRNIGVNRISLGIQSFNNRFLKFLGRGHDRQEAIKAFDQLRESGFDNVSADLMYSFPGQTSEELENDVKGMIALKSDHVSLYSLTIEERSRFYVQGVQLDDPEKLAEDYMLILRLLEEGGLNQYEISNFARPGKESQHNLNYWQGGEYIGLGVGAHSHQNGRRYSNGASFPVYLKLLKEGKDPLDTEEQLTPAQRLVETVLFGLRTNAGVCLSDLEQRFHQSLESDKKNQIAQWVQDGFLIENDGVLLTTLKGRLVLDELSARLI